MNSDRRDERDHEARLHHLAGAVVDCEAVDWGAVESAATEDFQPLIRVLKAISGVAETHRRDHWADPDSPVDVVEPAIYVVRESWGSLQIIARVGTGMFGEVYRARDPQLDREVALKLFYPDRLGRARPAQVLIEEGRLLARVRHPNVAVVYGAEEHDDRVGIWMEFVEGATLEEYVDEKGPLDPAEAMAIGRDVCRALAALHDAEIVHRDIKASNVMREEGGRVVLLDLGASRDTANLDSGGLYGTPYYAAPEVLIRNESSPTSDIYSLGVLLFYMVTGQYPVEGQSVRELREAHTSGQIKQLEEIRPDLPKALSRVVARALMPEPEARIASAQEFEEALTDALEAKARSRRRLARLLMLLATLAVVAGAWIWGPWRGAPFPETVPHRIAIAPLVNRTGDPANDQVGMLAADAVVQRFAETGAAEAVMTSLVTEDAQDGGAADARSPPEDRLVAAARRNGAAFLLSGACYLEGGALNLQARLTDTTTGESVYTFAADTDDPSAATAGAEALAEKVLAGVAAHLDPYLDISVMRPPESYEVYQLWLRGQEHPEDLISFYRRALELDPRYHIIRFFLLDHLVFRWLAERDVESLMQAEEVCSAAERYLDEFTPFERAYYRYQVARCAGDLVAVLNQARQMSRLAPDLWWVPMFQAFSAAIVNRPHEAVDVLRSAYSSYTPESHLARDFVFLQALAANVHFTGDYEAQLDFADEGLDLYPDVSTFYALKAAAHAALGQVDAAERVIDGMLRYDLREGYSPGQIMVKVATELSYHGHPEAADRMEVRAVRWYERQIAESGPETLDHDNRWTHACALRLTGRWQEAREILVELKEAGWRVVDVEGSLGIMAALAGDRDEAQRVAERLGASGDRYTADRRLYWRACIAAHLDEKDRAVTLLGEAFARGLSYDTLHKPGHDAGGWHLHSDEDLEPLWHYPAFEKLIEPQG